MAGDWMKIELDLPDKPEIHNIAGITGLDPDNVVGKLIRVWQWFDKHTTDGNARGVTYSLIDRITGVTGFGEAMAFCGWLEQKDVFLVMPKFDRHTSKSAKKRATTTSRVKEYRKNKGSDCNADSVTKALPEKRREENIKPSVSHDKIVFDGTSFQNLNGYVDAWQRAFPAINVEAEINKAAAWLVSNPKNAKSNYSRFLNGWLTRAQDKAPRAQSDSPSFAVGAI